MMASYSYEGFFLAQGGEDAPPWQEGPALPFQLQSDKDLPGLSELLGLEGAGRSRGGGAVEVGESDPGRVGEGDPGRVGEGDPGRVEEPGGRPKRLRMGGGGVAEEKSSPGPQEPAPQPATGKQQRSRQRPTANAKSSVFRGVTRHRWTGRYEAHLWDSDSKRPKTSGKGRLRGRQVYLGGFMGEEDAARAYDRAACKYWGSTAHLNFPREQYAAQEAEDAALSREDVVAALRRLSSGFARGASKFRGVTKHHQLNRWEARIGRIHGNKFLYLGSFEAEVEAARAYDRAAIQHRGAKAVTNFHLSEYEEELAQSRGQWPEEGEVVADPPAQPSPHMLAPAGACGDTGGELQHVAVEDARHLLQPDRLHLETAHYSLLLAGPAPPPPPSSSFSSPSLGSTTEWPDLISIDFGCAADLGGAELLL